MSGALLPPAFDGWARQWADLVAASWLESLMLFAVAALVWVSLRRWAPSQLGYGLFLLVLLKIAFPLSIVLPPEWAAWFPGYHVDQAMDSLAAAEPVAADPVAAEPGPAAETAVPVAALPPEPEEASAFAPFVPWLFGAWIVVVMALSIRFVVVQRRTRGIVRRARRVAPGDLAVEPASLLDTMGLRRTRVRFLVSEEIASPAAGGLLRPFVLVPDGLMQQLPAAQCRWVLLHELAHIRRGDLWVALFQRVLQIAFFFHPLVWVVNRLVNEQREFACDEAAVAASGGRRKSCGEGFLSVVEWAQGQAPLAHGTLGMVSSKQLIRRRLMRILDGRGRGGAKSKVLCMLAIAAIGAVFVPSVRAQQGQKSDEDLRLEILQERLKKWEAEVRIMRLELERLQNQRGGKSAPQPGVSAELPFWQGATGAPKAGPWTGVPVRSPRETRLNVPKGRVMWATPKAEKAGARNAFVQEWTENAPKATKKGDRVFWGAPKAAEPKPARGWVERTAPAEPKEPQPDVFFQEPGAPPAPKAPKASGYVRGGRAVSPRSGAQSSRGYFKAGAPGTGVSAGTPGTGVPAGAPRSGVSAGGAGTNSGRGSVFGGRAAPPRSGSGTTKVQGGRGYSRRPASGGGVFGGGVAPSRSVRGTTTGQGATDYSRRPASGGGVFGGQVAPSRAGSGKTTGQGGAGYGRRPASGGGRVRAPRSTPAGSGSGGVRRFPSTGGGAGGGNRTAPNSSGSFGGSTWNTAIGLGGGAGGGVGRVVPAPEPKPAPLPKADPFGNAKKKGPRSGVR